jgi:hypothetical protein
LWGGKLEQTAIPQPAAPEVIGDDSSGRHQYALVAIGPQGNRTSPSPAATAQGLARLEWESVAGADAYLVIRDGKEVAGPLRIEGARKHWSDKVAP